MVSWKTLADLREPSTAVGKSHSLMLMRGATERTTICGGCSFAGRVTYQGFAAAWPSVTDEEGFADKMNGMPKFVASTTLTQAEWNATLIKGDVAEEVSKLKQQPGKNLLIFGS